MSQLRFGYNIHFICYKCFNGLHKAAQRSVLDMSFDCMRIKQRISSHEKIQKKRKKLHSCKCRKVCNTSHSVGLFHGGG